VLFQDVQRADLVGRRALRREKIGEDLLPRDGDTPICSLPGRRHVGQSARSNGAILPEPRPIIASTMSPAPVMS